MHPPAQPPRVPKPLLHSGTGHKFYPHPWLKTSGRQAGRHSFATNEPETVRRKTNSLPP